jgi:hypothetical protein
VALFLAALSLATTPSPAAASVTLGQLPPATPLATCGAVDTDWVQPTVTSGNPYVVPGTGTITSWSHRAAGAGGQMVVMKVFRKVADPSFYQVVGHDGPRPMTMAVLNTFLVSIPVKAGDVLGINGTHGAGVACGFDAPGDSYLFRVGNLADGEADAFTPVESNRRLNISAVFSPSNTFTLGKVKRNTKKGTATLTVDLPNPGELSASGKGVKAAGAAVITKTVSAPGKVKLLIKAKGKKRKTLNETGKVKLSPRITYTPTSGDPSTQSTKLKLRKS